LVLAASILALTSTSASFVAAGGAVGPDVTVTKASSKASVAAGGSYSYLITVRNAGTQSATGVAMVDTTVEPDVDVDFSSLTWNPASAGTCGWRVFGTDPNNLACSFGTVAAGAQVSVSFSVTAPAATCPRVRNTSTVSATNEPTANQGNNSAVVNVPMTGCPDPTASPTPTPTPAPGPTVGRIFGADRYATAALLSQRRVPAPGSGVSAVYVASGENFPDALAAGPAASRRGGPLLLVRANSIPGPTRNELQRLKPATIYVAGGTAVISSAVVAELRTLSRTNTVVRFAGVDRYDTAARTVAQAFPSADAVMIATGENFPDALAGGAAAADRGMPILLTRGSILPAPTKAQIDRLQPSRIYIVGGTAAVNAAVESALRGGGRTVVRISGQDRYLTAVGVSRAFFHEGAGHLFVATGTNFPDALSAGPLADPVLLTPRGGLPSLVAVEATRLDPSSIHVLGGPTVVSDAVVNQLRAT
jgi:putative cell wall-binding protein